MTERTHRRIVVDTNIALGAGGNKQPLPPEAEVCTDFLDALRESGHLFVQTFDITEEWLRMARPFALTWLSGLPNEAIYEASSDIENVAYLPAMREEIMGFADRWLAHKYRSSWSAQQKEQMRADVQQDIFLIEAAIVTDGIVISCERKIREFFVDTAIEIQELRDILWVRLWEKPTPGRNKPPWMKDSQEIKEWLEHLAQGTLTAQELEQLKLGYRKLRKRKLDNIAT